MRKKAAAQPPPPDVDPLLVSWWESMEADSLSYRTMGERLRVIGHAARQTGEGLTGMTLPGIRRWLGRQSPGARYTYRAVLKAWHKWLVSEDLRTDDPTAKLGKAKAPSRDPHPVSTVELERLIAHAREPRLRMMVLLAALHGLRVHEVAKVHGEDVDRAAGTMKVVGKGDVKALLHLRPEVLQLAADTEQFPVRGYWFPGRRGSDVPMRPDSVSRLLSTALRESGGRGSAHWLRHWYGTELIRSGVDMRTTQVLMRHQSPSSTSLYVEVNDDQRRAAGALLPDVTGAGALRAMEERS